MKTALYSEVRSQMRPGDVIAFAGKDNFSEEVTSIALCGFSLLAEDYYLLTGETLEIKSYNSRNPENFRI
jgi:hypothetical protein